MHLLYQVVEILVSLLDRFIHLPASLFQLFIVASYLVDILSQLTHALVQRLLHERKAVLQGSYDRLVIRHGYLLVVVTVSHLLRDVYQAVDGANHTLHHMMATQ